MKKVVLIILVLALVLSLTACGKSPEFKAATKLITDIGEVTLDSEQAILSAEEAFAALTPEEQANLENASVLTEARAAYDTLVEEAERAAEQERVRLALCGEWVQVGGPYQGLSFLLKDDGSAEQKLPEEGSGSWVVADDSGSITLSVGGADAILAVAETDKGFTLSRDEAVFCSLDHMEAGLGQKITVKLDPETVTDYLGEPVSVSKLYYFKLFWWEYYIFGYQFPSKLYDLGYLYLAYSDDYDITYETVNTKEETDEGHLYRGPFSLLRVSTDLEENPLSWPLYSFTNVEGELTFVRKEYVEDIVFTADSNSSYESDKENGVQDSGSITTYDFPLIRTVKLLNGEEYPSKLLVYSTSEPLFTDADAKELYEKAPY